MLETEATVISGITENDATASVLRAKQIKAMPDQLASNAFALSVGSDRHRPEAEPTAIFTVDGNGREGDVPEEHAVFDRDKRENQCASVTQARDDLRFRLIAMFYSGKCLRRHIGDGRLIALLLSSYQHAAAHNG